MANVKLHKLLEGKNPEDLTPLEQELLRLVPVEDCECMDKEPFGGPFMVSHCKECKKAWYSEPPSAGTLEQDAEFHRFLVGEVEAMKSHTAYIFSRKMTEREEDLMFTSLVEGRNWQLKRVVTPTASIQETIQVLESTVDDLIKQRDALLESHKHEVYTMLCGKVKALREALERYGDCDDDCKRVLSLAISSYEAPCSCGFRKEERT